MKSRGSRRRYPDFVARTTVPNPIAIRQWVVATGLVLQAEDLQTRGTSIDHATALIVADTAAEATLGLISSFLSDPLTGEDHGTYLKRAERRAKLPARLVVELRAVHKLRNGAVHHAAEVASVDSQRAISAARELVDTYVPRVLRSTRVLGPGAGIPDAVAALIGDHPIAVRLQFGADALRRRDEVVALEHFAAGLYLTRIYATPALPRPPSLRFPRGLPSRDETEAEDWRRDVENWVVPMALGLSPRAYSSLSSVGPGVVYIPGSGEPGGRFIFPPGLVSPAPGTARPALERLSFMVLRLLLSDGLRYPEGHA